MDRVLAVSENSPIKNFSLKCRKGFEPDCINRHVLNRGVKDLDLDVDAKDGYSLPFEIFTCNTLVGLKLTGFSIDVIPEDASLPALKSVMFYSLHACAFEKLLSACPLLQDLFINDLNWEQWKWSRSLSSPSLERLAIERTEFYGFDGSDFGSITFDIPNITHLDYCELYYCNLIV
ncbi:putative F-box/LRR-repeat protein [Cardamine amara subsp. amara]|uniref:F-box/LRR-repeat protein n=1 Tax=Cardamine amara subsp. amara TaxID=228776 RepID=A0ABD0ZLG1_CARAN